MIKIVATKKISGPRYLIELLNNKTVMEYKFVRTLKERDDIIKEWVDTYLITDVHYIVEKAKRKASTAAAKPIIPIIYFEDEFELENYVNTNSMDIFNRILSEISVGIENKKKKLKLFDINGTGTYVCSNRKDWKSGLEVAKRFYTNVELYEKCTECDNLMQKLKK